MKISQAFREGARVVLSRKAEALKLLITEFAVSGICLAPLLMLTAEGVNAWIPVAVSALMWMLIKVPARLNAAAAMQDALGEGSLFSLRVADPGNYGKKLLYGLRHLLLLTLWSAPLIAAGIFAWDQYAGDTDGLTVMQSVYDFGGGDMKTGVIRLLLILLLLILIAAAGAGFHSGDRHAWVLEKKDLLKGKRPRVLLCRICTLCCLLPLIIAAGIAVMRYVPLLNDVSGVISGDVPRPDSRTTLLILAAGGVLTLPLIPLRSMITAAYVRGLK